MKKILVLGIAFLYITVNAKFLQIPGAVDLDFGPNGNGFTTLELGGATDIPRAMVIDSKGRIILGGHSLIVSEDFAVARFSANGIVDDSFGPTGAGFTLLNFGGVSNDLAFAVVLDSQERILLGGFSNFGGSDDFAVARFDQKGLVDLSFGPSHTGFVTLGFAVGSTDQARAMVLDNKGRIVLAGQSNANGDIDFAAARFKSNGLVDNSFGPNGLGFSIVPSFGPGSVDVANAMAIDKLGRIILVGQTNANGQEDFAVVRLDKNGLVDTSFGPNGTGITLFPSFGPGSTENAFATVLDSQGRVLIAGRSDANGSVDFALARLTKDGIVDSSFGTSGPGFTLLDFGGFDIANAVVLDSQGRILLGGFSNAAGTDDFAVARFSGEGVLDLSFGPLKTGFVTFDIGGIDDGLAIAVDSKGGILICGERTSGPSDFALARFFGEEFNTCALALREKYCFLP